MTARTCSQAFANTVRKRQQPPEPPSEDFPQATGY
jgi:hypothetical protein